MKDKIIRWVEQNPKTAVAIAAAVFLCLLILFGDSNAPDAWTH